MKVSVENISKYYGQQKAVDSVSFNLNPGEVTGFIGPNGAGKSTSMKIICGLIEPDEGRVLFDDLSLSGSPLEIKQKLGFLPESNPLYYDQYVLEYLQFVGKIYKLKNLNARIKEVVQLTGLEPERKKKIGQLSKGYKQRVGLAQALIHDPEVLILDEPTTGLDPNQLTEIRDLIKSIARNKTVLLSTHILQEVEAICHRVLMINKGRIVTNESTETLKSGSSGNFSVIVEFKQDVTETVISQIPGVKGLKQVGNNKWILESENQDDIREQIFDFARHNALSILEMQTQKYSLEETFRRLSDN